jgi:pimeloyl-ACP methyl ester carboxylesterase
LGYDTPPNPLNTLSPTDVWTTMTDDQAQAGAVSLSSYLQEVRANNPTGHVTLLGHSYGSLTSSLALQDLNAQGLHPVNDVVFYGSPGLELTSPDQLGLGAGQAYVMQAPDDPITSVVAPLAPLHGWGADRYAGILPELSSQAGFDPGNVFREGVQSHSDYPRLASDGNLRMSGYNMAAAVAGLPTEQLVFAPPPAVPLLPLASHLPLPQATPGG